LEKDFIETINTKFEEALKDDSSELMKEALRAWMDNNAAFLNLALNRVQQELETEK
jgi:hypothetical protein